MARLSVAPVRSGSSVDISARANSKPEFDTVMFAGDGDTRTIAEALIACPEVSLTVLIDACDDGSTEAWRALVPGFPDPSSVRKNLVALLDPALPDRTPLAALLDSRLPEHLTLAAGLAMVEALGTGASRQLPAALASSFRELRPDHAAFVIGGAQAFGQFARAHSNRRAFDLSHCRVGNLVLAGAFLAVGRDFNRMIAVASERLGVRGRILNVTDGSPCEERLESQSLAPAVSPAAARALAEATLIVYGPGMPFSSLLPSYLAEGLATVIAANRRAPKVLIGNLRVDRDHDSQPETANTLVNKTLQYLRSRSPQLRDADLVTHVFAHRPAGRDRQENTLTFEPLRRAAAARLRLVDWEDPSSPGQHNGRLVLDELLRLCEEWPECAVQRLSIVIPACNKARVIGELLDRVIAVDLRHHGVEKEIIVIDDASTDETGAIARARPGVTVLTQPVTRGKGAAVRRGIERATGDWILIQEADLEHDPKGIYKLVSAVVYGKFQAVHGGSKLQGDRSTRSWGRRCGGLVLSLATLALYGRYLADTVTGYKLYAAPLVKSFRLTSTGNEFGHEITANLLRRGVEIFEVPASYDPRSRADDKNIRARDGFMALWTLLRCRVSRA